MRRTNAHLARAGHARQAAVVHRADSAAAAVDRASGGVWAGLLRLLATAPHWADAHRQALHLFRGLVPAAAASLAPRLDRLARWTVRDTVSTLTEVVPLPALRQAAYLSSRRQLLRPVQESLTLADLLAPLRPPSPLDEGAARSLLADLLFPPPGDALIDRVVYGSGWQERLHACTRLAPPEQLAQVVAGGLAAGKPHRQIAQELLPLVNNVRVSARRVARTEALRVAGASQMVAHKSLGSLVVGYQVHATIDEVTRWWHAKRNEQIYYLDPGPGQLSTYQCPHPPDEAADAAERPPKAPATAPNCRCYLSPVLRG